jgi:glycyl-tRNA synthetase beta chain
VADLLFELGSEELPARFVGPLLEDLERVFREQAAALGLIFQGLKTFGTPRRLAILVQGLPTRTADSVKELMGPPVKAAFDDTGAPKIPATKFAESVGIAVDKLLRVQTPKGEYLAARVEEKGKDVAGLCSGVLNACVRGLKFPKSMRWGDVEQSYGRPLQWMVAMLDATPIDVVFADVRSGTTTFGHRFLAPQAVKVSTPEQYESLLEKACVIAAVDTRKAMLQSRLADAAKQAGGTLLHDEQLLDEVVQLVELPNPVVGTFDAKHLDLPKEVLISEMKTHQRYFSLVDSAGKLLPKFIAVSNTPVKDVALSVKGYERVLRARLSDGRFFFDEDCKHSLESRNERLKRRTWVAGLGTVADKVDRIVTLSEVLAKATGNSAELETVRRVAQLCKADLETGMVGEFPELQGVMGREYALKSGEAPPVALGIFEHYLPKGAGDLMPSAPPGALVGLADRIDSLVGLFALGKKPTGAKDEYGQRRACLAVVNVTLSKGYRYSLRAVLEQAEKLSLNALKEEHLKKSTVHGHVKVGPSTVEQVLEFVRGRLESLWRETFRPDLVEAVLSTGFDDLVETHQRLVALDSVAKAEDFPALAATFKRVANIVEKQAGSSKSNEVDTDTLVEDAEKALFTALTKVEKETSTLFTQGKFEHALKAAVTLKAPVDGFFDKVMVMAEDEKVRNNRLAMLRRIQALFGRVADFAKIQS